MPRRASDPKPPQLAERLVANHGRAELQAASAAPGLAPGEQPITRAAAPTEDSEREAWEQQEEQQPLVEEVFRAPAQHEHFGRAVVRHEAPVGGEHRLRPTESVHPREAIWRRRQRLPHAVGNRVARLARGAVVDEEVEGGAARDDEAARVDVLNPRWRQSDALLCADPIEGAHEAVDRRRHWKPSPPQRVAVVVMVARKVLLRTGVEDRDPAPQEGERQRVADS
mmetsp:Transcript_26823/g.66389  ORF Transcript_26823/g.66389 Transcript_26823/m.66389 type:complete len:225 (+) Transcript_26823:497-1171(+)